jgi:hypothetical protein
VRILAIDPGTSQSAIVGYDSRGEVLDKGIQENEKVLEAVAHLHSLYELLVVEMVASYGMPVGADVFETVFWVGRFCERWQGEWTRILRRDVKLHLCASARAKDANVRQALIDRFGPGREKAIGTKRAKGPLYGVVRDEWAALAVAVTVGDREQS